VVSSDCGAELAAPGELDGDGDGDGDGEALGAADCDRAAAAVKPIKISAKKVLVAVVFI